MVQMYSKYKQGEKEDKLPLSEQDKNAIDPSIAWRSYREFCVRSRSQVWKITRKEITKKILASFPEFKQDPIALAFLKDPDLLQEINEFNIVEKIVKDHPVLGKCAQLLVALTNERSSSVMPTRQASSSLNSFSSPYLSGDEEMDISPSAESRITPDLLAAALRSASRSTSSSTSQSTAITPEIVNSAMMQIISSFSNPSGTTTAPTSSSSSASVSGNNSTSVTSPTLASQMEQYASQMQQMRELGLTGDAILLQALQLTNGDVPAAINLVFSGSLTGS